MECPIRDHLNPGYYSRAGRHVCCSLSAGDPTMVYVPEGCAHGFQTLDDDSVLLYMISTSYDTASARGIRWNDPALGIPWPHHDTVLISERDRELPLLSSIATPFP